MNNGKVNIRSLRKFVDETFPRNSVLRELILGEPDQINVQEFLTKMKIWLRLLRMESGKSYYGKQQ
ncbi:hypothetical protein J7K27_07440 [Candidatus Bathyarchaeota archaeon]|nr:hypothetical protein [Candidatus Bathyarchaeota archaeon]